MTDTRALCLSGEVVVDARVKAAPALREREGFPFVRPVG
jgi:hypothetical protein